jgi:hypothetical protein
MAEDHSLVRGLVRDWEPVHEHEAKPDPHPDYALEVDALAAFGFAAYAGMNYNGTAAAFPDIGAAWQDVDIFNTLSVGSPRHMAASIPDSTLTLEGPGVYFLSIAFSMNHDSVNGGRSFSLRLMNHTTQAPVIGNGYLIGTGRNAASTAGGISTLIESPNVLPVDHPISLQVGDAKNANGTPGVYSDVDFTSFSYTVHSVGEFRGTLGDANIQSGGGVGVQGMGRGSGDRPPG